MQQTGFGTKMVPMKGFSLILAVLNEENNIQKLLDDLDDVIDEYQLNQINEVIFVDDGSKDRTVALIKDNEKIRKHYSIKLIERREKLGLVSAHIAGARNASNERVIIMDSDLQHPITRIPQLIKEIEEGNDLVIASRYIEGGGNSWTPIRGVISRGAIFIAHIFIKQSREISDPVSGYFVTHRSMVSGLHPYSEAYKLLLYVLSSNDAVRAKEVPFTMKERVNGNSKIVDKKLGFVLKYMIEIVRYWRQSKGRRFIATSRSKHVF